MLAFTHIMFVGDGGVVLSCAATVPVRVLNGFSGAVARDGDPGGGAGGGRGCDEEEEAAELSDGTSSSSRHRSRRTVRGSHSKCT
jgi:hypothetical protein